MEVKGTAVISIPLFIREKFGDEGFDKWFNELSPEAKKVFSGPIIATDWLSLKSIFLAPTELICKLFFNGDLKGAWASGRYSADYGLKGVYKMFIKIGSVNFLINKASIILPTYYKPSKMEVVKCEKDNMILRCTEFPDMHPIIEHRIAGWIERAIEINGCKNVNIKITKSLTKNDPYTEFTGNWK